MRQKRPRPDKNWKTERISQLTPLAAAIGKANVKAL